MTDLYIIGGALLAIIMGLLGYGTSKRQQGKKDAKGEQNADKIKREAAARDAVKRGRDSGLSPADRVRGNDSGWRGL